VRPVRLFRRVRQLTCGEEVRPVVQEGLEAAISRVTTRSAHPTQLGGWQTRPCRRVVLSGNTRSGRKPRRARTHGVDRGGDAPSDKHELCDRKFTCPRRRPRGSPHASPSYLVRSPQTFRKPPSDTRKGTSENPSPQGPWGQPQWRTAEGSSTALSRGGGRVLRDTLAAPRGQGRGVMLVNSPSRAYTKFGH